MSPEICDAITGADADAFRITKAYEASDGPALSSIASKLGYPESERAQAASPPLPASPASPANFSKQKPPRGIFLKAAVFRRWVQQVAPQIASMSASYDSEWFFIPAQYLRVQSWIGTAPYRLPNAHPGPGP